MKQDIRTIKLHGTYVHDAANVAAVYKKSVQYALAANQHLQKAYLWPKQNWIVKKLDL